MAGRLCEQTERQVRIQHLYDRRQTHLVPIFRKRTRWGPTTADHFDRKDARSIIKAEGRLPIGKQTVPVPLDVPGSAGPAGR